MTALGSPDPKSTTVSRFRQSIWRVRGQRFQIEARAEVAIRSGQHPNRKVGVLLKAPKGIGQGGSRLRVDRVARLRPGDGDGHHAVFGRNLDVRPQRSFPYSASMYG